MQEQDEFEKFEVILTTPEQAPFLFEVTIREKVEHASFVFEITWKEPDTNSQKSGVYALNEREHTSYLSLFEKLSSDFGLRLSINRSEPSAKPTAKIPLREVLTQNLNSGILYGYGDPAVLRVDGTNQDEEVFYYLLATSNDAPNSFPILRSRDLKTWEFINYVFSEGQKPDWAAEGELISDYWAPELHRVGNEFRVYFVARDKNTRELCIGMARSSSPEGPFLADPEPILKENVIDPHIYVQEDDVSFLFWKEDNNDVWPRLLIDLLYSSPHFIQQLFDQEEDQKTASFILTIWPWAKMLEPMERFLVTQVFIESVTSRFLQFYNQLPDLQTGQSEALQEEIRTVQQFMKTPLYAQQLSPDGSTLIGTRTKIIENDLAWEAHLVEGMWVTKQADTFYLFYAGNDFSTDQYGIGVAYANNLLGPYQKIEAPILQSTAEWWAPGHPSVVTGPDGKPQLILHAYFPEKAGYKEFRAVLSVPLTFEGDKVSLG